MQSLIEVNKEEKNLFGLFKGFDSEIKRIFLIRSSSENT